MSPTKVPVKPAVVPMADKYPARRAAESGSNDGRKLFSMPSSAPTTASHGAWYGPITMQEAVYKQQTFGGKQARGVQCSHWYTTSRADTCYSVRKLFGADRLQFALWNPSVRCPLPGDKVRLCVRTTPMVTTTGESNVAKHAKVFPLERPNTPTCAG